jgi:hypothetical protein
MGFEQIIIKSGAPKKIEGERPIIPTLLIGLGGTGKEILLRMRRLIVERFGSLGALPCIEFLHIDTDQKQTAKEQYDLKADDDTLFKKVKFQPAETIPLTIEGGTTRYIENVDKYPNIKRWFQHKGKIAGLGDLGEGAGQIRMASRLAFFHEPNFTKISDTLNRVKSKLQDPKITEQVAKYSFQFDPKSMEVYIITSVGGGTGSGIFLDIAFLVKDIFSDAERVGMLFMPKLYEKYSGHPRIYANGYAALMELNKYSFGYKFLANWKGANIKEILPPPFSYTYFLDATNESGFTENNEKAIYQMAAETIFQDYSIGGFAAMKRSTRVNLMQYTMNVYVHDYWEIGMKKTAMVKDIKVQGDTYPARFSSMGLGVISFPADKVRSACACKMARNILNFWQSKLTEDPLENLITRFLILSEISFFQGEYERRDGGGRIERMDIEEELLFYNRNAGLTFENYLWEKCLNSKKEMETAPKGKLAGILQDYRKRFDQLMAKEDSEDYKEWGEDVRLIESTMNNYLKRLKEGIKKEADRLANSPKHGVAYALSILVALKDLLPKGSENDSFRYKQYFETKIPEWRDTTSYYLGELEQLQRDLDKHDGALMFRKEDIKRDLDHLFGTKNEPGAFYNYMYARVMKQVVKRGKQICQDIDDFLGKDSETGRGLLGEYRRLLGGFEKINNLLADKEKYFSRDFYAEKGYSFWLSLYKDGDVPKWYHRWMGTGEIEEKRVEEIGNQLLKNIFHADSVTEALAHIEKTPEEEIEDKVLKYCKNYLAAQDDQPSALQILMDANRFIRSQQEQIIRSAYGMARVWVKGGGVDHVNVHSPDSGQKPSYIGVDGNDVVRRKEFVDIVEKIKGAGEITQYLDIGGDHKSSIVFYNELAGVTAFYPQSVAVRGGLKQRYNEFYSHSKDFDPNNQEELHTDKNRFQFSDLIPKTDDEVFRYKGAIRAFVLARLLGLLRVEESETGKEFVEDIYCYEYRDPFDGTSDEITLGDELNSIDMLYRDTGEDESWRDQILDKVEETIDSIIEKEKLANYLLVMEFYLREVYPPQKEHDKEQENMLITRFSPQYAILELERRRIYEKKLIDSQKKKQVVNALNSLRCSIDDKEVRYSDYVEALTPFAKKAGKFERIEETTVGQLKSVYYNAYALDLSKLGLVKERAVVKEHIKKSKVNEPADEQKRSTEPEAMTRSCPGCGKDINIRANYCFHCKKDVSEHVTCPQCGETKVPADLKSCWKCGYQIKKEEKTECPRCYSFKGYKSDFPCKVCGYSFETGEPGEESVGFSKNFAEEAAAGTGAAQENKGEPTGEKEEEPGAQDNTAGFQQEQESSAPGPGGEKDLVECQNCFSMVKKGPRCPFCQAPLEY